MDPIEKHPLVVQLRKDITRLQTKLDNYEADKLYQPNPLSKDFLEMFPESERFPSQERNTLAYLFAHESKYVSSFQLLKVLRSDAQTYYKDPANSITVIIHRIRAKLRPRNEVAILGNYRKGYSLILNPDPRYFQLRNFVEALYYKNPIDYKNKSRAVTQTFIALWNLIGQLDRRGYISDAELKYYTQYHSASNHVTNTERAKRREYLATFLESVDPTKHLVHCEAKRAWSWKPKP